MTSQSPLGSPTDSALRSIGISCSTNWPYSTVTLLSIALSSSDIGGSPSV
ncbi:hypothetical protein QRX50_26235 [Amycolatopsis carbonis]|uniref:Uncharacterized protein n=1 Tax=Amycolatopsis carbonis TaxID=715471 RepID=A0A9Y2I8P5_9PSEU|nr:hypothetical protein [Amycolatopsis sp. 2-15]WIX75049.1 hypothetical protein QRX50_26235 [Amycolatopsis sp. 2-15]